MNHSQQPVGYPARPRRSSYPCCGKKVVCRLLMFTVSIVAFFRLSQADDATGSPVYARGELLIEAKELAKVPSRPGSRLILDVRSAESFSNGHLKDAVHVVGADWTKDFGDGQTGEPWARRFSSLGIGRDTEVIVYDDRLGQDAARIWWYLKYWGVCQVRVVNGGWKSIQGQSDLSVVNGPSRIPTPTVFSSPPVASRRVDLVTLITASKAGQLNAAKPNALQLVDTRTEKEFRGEQAAEGVRPGTIPGSRRLEWSDIVDSSTERFRSSSEVRQILNERGIELDRPIVPFSNTRGRSSAISFPLELVGAVQVRIFDAGFKAWAADASNPVAPQTP